MRTRLLSLLAALLLPALAAATHEPREINESEPNDLCTQADRLTPWRDAGASGSVGNADLFDLYTTQAWRSERTSWSLFTPNRDNDLRAGASASCPLASTGASGSVNVHATGRHFLAVQYFPGSEDPVASYHLSVRVAANDAGTGGDAGGSFGEATSIGSGSHTGVLAPLDGARDSASSGASDEDWYRVSLPALSGVSASLAVESGDYTLDVYESSGNHRAAGDAVSCLADLPGDWRVRVREVGSQPASAYTLSIATGIGLPCLPV